MARDLRHGTQCVVPIREEPMTVCAWGCVAMRIMWSSACHVVMKILKLKKNIYKVSQLVMLRLVSAHAWHWVSRISWTVRNLFVTDGTTWRKLCVTLPSWQTSCHIVGHCGNKSRASQCEACCRLPSWLTACASWVCYLRRRVLYCDVSGSLDQRNARLDVAEKSCCWTCNYETWRRRVVAASHDGWSWQTSGQLMDLTAGAGHCIIIITRRALGRAHLPPTKVFRRLSEFNHFKATVRSSGFSRRKISRSSAARWQPI